MGTKKQKLRSDEVLSLRFECSDLDREVTIREYLCELLLTLWREGEGFSGKRPFGNSGWQYDLAPVLITSRVIDGRIDEDGYVEECDDDALTEVIESAILELAHPTV
jgi:hypothetical protein